MMITNNNITYYHKGIDTTNKVETWTKYIFEKVWKYGGETSNISNGIAKSKSVDIRIPMAYVNNTEIFSLGDIVAIGSHADISTQQDLEGIEHYVISGVRINNFGNNPHIHLIGS